MSCLKMLFAGLLILPLFGGVLPEKNLYADESNKEKIHFRWAFGAMVGPENDRRLVAITRDTELKTGDRLKMLVEFRAPCFVYVVHHSEKGDIAMLFPHNFNQFEADYLPSVEYYVPDGDRWFELDENVGLETFYLLASRTRLSELEILLTSHQKASGSEKQGLNSQILEEILRIKKRYRTLATPAERPIPIGGKVRGLLKEKGLALPDIDAIAENVSADGFYCRTFTIHHQ